MEVNRTSFKTNLSLDEILSKMNSSDPRDSVDENEERQFLDDFVSNPNTSYYICNKEELEIRNVQIN